MKELVGLPDEEELGDLVRVAVIRADSCQYMECSGDCDCDGDKGNPNPPAECP